MDPSKIGEFPRPDVLPKGPHDHRSDESVSNLNTATLEELTQPDFVSTSVAKVLLQVRDRQGGFRSWEELLQVPGIKPAMIAELQRSFKLARVQ